MIIINLINDCSTHIDNDIERIVRSNHVLMDANEFEIDDLITELTVVMCNNTILDYDQLRARITEIHRDILLAKQKEVNKAYVSDNVLF